MIKKIMPVHEISNKNSEYDQEIPQSQTADNPVVLATSKGSDQPAHTRSLIRAFASRLNNLWILSY